jgi:hypothetical protein
MPIGQITTPEIEQVGRPAGLTGSASQLEQSRPISAERAQRPLRGSKIARRTSGLATAAKPRARAASQDSTAASDKRHLSCATFASPWIFGYPT